MVLAISFMVLISFSALPSVVAYQELLIYVAYRNSKKVVTYVFIDKLFAVVTFDRFRAFANLVVNQM